MAVAADGLWYSLQTWNVNLKSNLQHLPNYRRVEKIEKSEVDVVQLMNSSSAEPKNHVLPAAYYCTAPSCSYRCPLLSPQLPWYLSNNVRDKTT